ncbi:MAG TPA: DUF1043 family protein [Cycloclasticus sp.]|nr:DUF1043 family protein [Cycloclasticus sp.]
MAIDMMLGLIVGIIVGFALFYAFSKFDKSGDSSRIKELEAEHQQYRKKVDDHFVNTAVLFKGLTEQYRDVYRHIASGAGDLCSEEAKAVQIDLEETALLAQPDAEVEVAEVAAEEVTEADKKFVAKAVVDEDDVPLASEVEMPAELAEKLKNQAADKKN